MEKPQSFYIFSDIDGTFMNHNNYCYESIINFVELIKKKCEIIFVSSKTFSEIKIINEKLNIEFPFIVHWFPGAGSDHTSALSYIQWGTENPWQAELTRQLC